MKNNIKTSDIITDYNRIFSSTGIRTHSAYYRWILRLLRPKPGQLFLDVSCGEGILLREISKRLKPQKTFGLDISDKAISLARKNSSDSLFMVADGQKLPFSDNLFDYVTCLGSLEHYLDPAMGIREICRVAKRDARFCIVLPNSLSIDLFLHVAKEGEKPVDDFQILEKTCTRKEWESLLRDNGLAIEATYGSNLWPELFQEGTWKVKSIAKFMKRSFTRCFCPVNLAREFVFICSKG